MVLMLMLLLFNVNFLIRLAIPPVEAMVGEESLVLSPPILYSKGDAIFVMGEIINKLGTAIREVNVTVTFESEGGDVLKEVYSSVFLEVIPPGRRSAFKTSVKIEEVKNFKKCDVKVSSYKSSDSKPPGFSITWAKAVLYPDRTEVTGQVRNILSSQIKALNVFALLYNEDGFIGVTDSDLTIIELKQDQTNLFKCTTWLINDTFNVVKCIITGESRSYSMEEEKTITSAKNGNEGPNYTMVTAIIIGVGALAISLIVLRKRYKKWKHRAKRKLSRKLILER